MRLDVQHGVFSLRAVSSDTLFDSKKSRNAALSRSPSPSPSGVSSSAPCAEAEASLPLSTSSATNISAEQIRALTASPFDGERSFGGCSDAAQRARCPGSDGYRRKQSANCHLKASKLELEFSIQFSFKIRCQKGRNKSWFYRDPHQYTCSLISEN